jgi:hypothetical protein
MASTIPIPKPYQIPVNRATKNVFQLFNFQHVLFITIYTHVISILNKKLLEE